MPVSYAMMSYVIILFSEKSTKMFPIFSDSPLTRRQTNTTVDIMDSSTWNPFSSLLVKPEEIHQAITSDSHPRRIIPVAAGQTSALDQYEKHRIPGSM
jgi:hypothetical protein